MKKYPSYEALPANPVYIGSDDMPGLLSEGTADQIATESWGIELAYIIDENGFRSFSHGKNHVLRHDCLPRRRTPINSIKFD